MNTWSIIFFLLCSFDGNIYQVVTVSFHQYAKKKLKSLITILII
jgi:hypothetical protein